jgi:hypothetical protein
LRELKIGHSNAIATVPLFLDVLHDVYEAALPSKLRSFNRTSHSTPLTDEDPTLSPHLPLLSMVGAPPSLCRSHLTVGKQTAHNRCVAGLAVNQATTKPEDLEKALKGPNYVICICKLLLCLCFVVVLVLQVL